MPITIKIKNLTANPITLADVDPPVTIDAGKEGDVPLDAVRAPAFGEQLAAGALAVSRTGLDDLEPDVRANVVQTIGDVILRVAPRFVGHYMSLTAAVSNLAALRDRYNELHGSTVALLTGAARLKGGIKNVVAAIDASDVVEDEALAKAKANRDKHLKKVPKDESELVVWFAEHKQLEAAVTAAELALANAKNAVERQLEATRSDLLAAAAVFDKADPAKDVGAKLTWGS